MNLVKFSLLKANIATFWLTIFLESISLSENDDSVLDKIL